MTRDTIHIDTCEHADVDVTVASLTGWYFDFPFVTAWDEMREWDLRGCGHSRSDRGGKILVTSSVAFDGRNDIVRNFLQHYPTSKYLLQIDSDMGTWPADAICKLLATAKTHDAHIVGGLAFAGGRTVCFPTIYERSKGKVAKPDGSGEVSVANINPVEEVPKVPVKCGATGGAFLLTSREVLLAVADVFGTGPDGYPNPHAWFQHVVLKGRNFGEDTTFCMRAAACGYDTWVDPSIETTHWKHLPLSREMYESGGRLNWQPHPSWDNSRPAQKRRERRQGVR